MLRAVAVVQCADDKPAELFFNEHMQTRKVTLRVIEETYAGWQRYVAGQPINKMLPQSYADIWCNVVKMDAEWQGPPIMQRGMRGGSKVTLPSIEQGSNQLVARGRELGSSKNWDADKGQPGRVGWGVRIDALESTSIPSSAEFSAKVHPENDIHAEEAPVVPRLAVAPFSKPEVDLKHGFDSVPEVALNKLPSAVPQPLAVDESLASPSSGLFLKVKDSLRKSFRWGSIDKADWAEAASVLMRSKSLDVAAHKQAASSDLKLQRASSDAAAVARPLGLPTLMPTFLSLGSSTSGSPHCSPAAIAPADFLAKLREEVDMVAERLGSGKEAGTTQADGCRSSILGGSARYDTSSFGCNWDGIEARGISSSGPLPESMIPMYSPTVGAPATKKDWYRDRQRKDSSSSAMAAAKVTLEVGAAEQSHVLLTLEQQPANGEGRSTAEGLLADCLKFKTGRMHSDRSTKSSLTTTVANIQSTFSSPRRRRLPQEESVNAGGWLEESASHLADSQCILFSGQLDEEAVTQLRLPESLFPRKESHSPKTCTESASSPKGSPEAIRSPTMQLAEHGRAVHGVFKVSLQRIGSKEVVESEDLDGGFAPDLPLAPLRLPPPRQSPNLRSSARSSPRSAGPSPRHVSFRDLVEVLTFDSSVAKEESIAKQEARRSSAATDSVSPPMLSPSIKPLQPNLFAAAEHSFLSPSSSSLSSIQPASPDSLGRKLELSKLPRVIAELGPLKPPPGRLVTADRVLKPLRISNVSLSQVVPAPSGNLESDQMARRKESTSKPFPFNAAETQSPTSRSARMGSSTFGTAMSDLCATDTVGRPRQLLRYGSLDRTHSPEHRQRERHRTDDAPVSSSDSECARPAMAVTYHRPPKTLSRSRSAELTKLRQTSEDFGPGGKPAANVSKSQNRSEELTGGLLRTSWPESAQNSPSNSEAAHRHRPSVPTTLALHVKPPRNGQRSPRCSSPQLSPQFSAHVTKSRSCFLEQQSVLMGLGSSVPAVQVD